MKQLHDEIRWGHTRFVAMSALAKKHFTEDNERGIPKRVGRIEFVAS
jgi:hypothetical protein